MHESFRNKLNYWLVVVTFALFLVLSGLFLYATFYIWYMSTAFPGWEYSPAYLNYISSMNRAAFYSSIALLVLLLLCIERRAFNLTLPLTIIAFALVSGGVITYITSIKTGFFLAMFIVALYQLVLAFLSIAGIRVHSEKQFRLEKTGSLLLHAGYALLAGAVGGLNSTPYEIPVFWLATALIIIGSFFAFYSSLFNRSNTELS